MSSKPLPARPSRGLLNDVYFPLFIFPALSYVAFKVIFTHLSASGGQSIMHNRCSPEVASFVTRPNMMPFTGKERLDEFLCGMVEFFHSVLQEPSLLAYNAVMLVAFMIMGFIPYIEASREGRRLTLSTPVIFGLVYQVITIGATFPLYWLTFLLSGAARTHLTPSLRGRITRANAESLCFGLLTGFLAPSLGMYFLRDATVTVIWQPFPLMITGFLFLHRFYTYVYDKLVEPTPHEEGVKRATGNVFIRNALLVCFLASAFAQSYLVWPLIITPDGRKWLLETFIPPLSTLSPFFPSLSTSGAARSSYNDFSDPLTGPALTFLQLDFVFAYLSTLLASLFFADSIRTALGLLWWFVVGTVAFGPGAVVAGVFIWREGQIALDVHNIEKADSQVDAAKKRK